MESYLMIAEWLWEVMVEPPGGLLFELCPASSFSKTQQSWGTTLLEEVCTYLPLTLHHPASQPAIGSHQQAEAFGLALTLWYLLFSVSVHVCVHVHVCERETGWGDNWRF